MKAQKTVIEVNNLSKTFLIPHQKRNTLKEHFTGLFNKVTYEKFEALKNVSFKINKGEFIGIVGRNGSGKSTLLKILALIYNPNKGKLKIEGNLSPFLELGVGFNPELTGKENVYLNGVVLGLTRKQIDQRYEEIVNFSELENFMDLKVKNYSSGMFVRLAFSVAIQVNADILLMDEVLAVGDTGFQEKCFDVFKKLKKQGKTIILVSHSMNNIEKFCDKVILLDKGKLIDFGSTGKIIYKYQQINMNTAEIALEKENKQRLENTKSEKEELAIEDKTILTQESADRWGNKEAEIIDVSIQDKNCREKYVFNSGDYIKFRIYFKINNPNIKIINAGFVLCYENDVEFLSANTLLDKYKMDIGKGYIDIIFKDTPIRAGNYYINCNICGIKLNPKYDYWRKIKTLKFVRNPDDIYNGLILSNYKWQ